MAVMAAALGAAAVDAAEDALARVRRAGELRWCGDLQGGEPYVFQDPTHDGGVVGFEVEIAAALARRLGVRATFVQNDWQMLVAALERGDCDIVLNGLEVTPARAARVRFSRPYYRFALTLVVRRTDAGRYRSLADLRGRRVATLGGSLAADVLGQSPVEIVLHEGVEEPYLDLEQGRVDGVVLDNIIAARYGLPRPDLIAAGEVGGGEYAIATRPADDDLGREIDEGLGAIAASGELLTILTSWQLWDGRQAALGSLAAGTVPPSTRTLGWHDVRLFLQGAVVTIVISTASMAIAVAVGLALSLLGRYGGRGAATLSRAYVEIFRGTPVLLQLYVLYYGLAPFVALDAFTAAVLGLGLNYAAYEAELYRAGLDAVPVEQTEAALALGMSRATALRRIVLPQAVRVALPGIANDFIALLKDTSLVSVITVVELTKQMTITAVDVRGWLVPGLLCAALYLAMSLPLARLARHLERRLLPAAAVVG
jgi:polar amino acid transport system substrate-binding protein